MRKAAIIAAIAAFIAVVTPAGAEMLIVLNKSDHEAALVDPAAYEVLAKLPTGKGPHEAAVSPDGKTAYVADYGGFAIFREGTRRQMQPGNTITVLDLEKKAVRTTFDLGEHTRPHGIWASRDGSRLWVTCEGTRSVLELDAKSGKIRKIWKTGQDVSHMLVPTPDESKLYVANIGSGSATVIERRSDSVRSIPTGEGAEGIDAAPDGREVWVSNRADHTISVIDVAADKVVASFDSGGKMPIRLKFTPDGKQVWVSNARSNSVTVFDAVGRRKIATIEVGAVPVGIQMTPDGSRAFVANTNDNRVTVIDTAARKVLRSFSTGNEPDGMAWVP